MNQSISIVPITKPLSKTNFDCGKHKTLNDYLRLYALKNDKLNIGKTFIAKTEDDLVAGYLTICTAQVRFNELPDQLSKGLPRYPVPAFRIAKLATDKRFQRKGIGKSMLTFALKKAIEISHSIGIYLILVDAIDEEAKGFYMKYGFVPFEEYSLTLCLPIETIRKAMM